MKWVQLVQVNDDASEIFGRIDDDGLMRVTCIREHDELQEWLAAGNQPEPFTPGGE